MDREFLELGELAARLGLVAIPYERQEGQWSRTRQLALVYLFHPVTDVYSYGYIGLPIGRRRTGQRCEPSSEPDATSPSNHHGAAAVS